MATNNIEKQSAGKGGALLITETDILPFDQEFCAITFLEDSTFDSNGLGWPELNVNKSSSPETVNYTVTVQDVGGSNKYFINGVQQPTLYLREGNTYVFDWSAATGHPLKFSETADGTHGGGSEYTTGVDFDSSNYKTTIVVASSAPTLYYYCSNHSGMGGTANTPSADAPLGGTTAIATGITFPKGLTIVGEFKSISLNSGKILAYLAV